MKNDKNVVSEVPIVITLEEAWEVVTHHILNELTPRGHQYWPDKRPMLMSGH